MYLHATTFEHEIARHHAAREHERVAALVEAILSGDHCDVSRIRALSTRDLYPCAARQLRAMLPNRKNLMQTIVSPPRPDLLAVRVASMFGAVRIRGDSDALPTVADVERIAKNQSDKGRRARIALALAGMPLGQWPSLSRPERAALTLRELVVTLKRRSS